jgi:DNA-binding NarL/FixJ family response regulator
MHVFLVEDSLALREVLRTRVEQMGGVVVGEASGQVAAIAGIRQSHPDIAIIDLQLEDGQGLDVIRAARLSSPDLTIIVLTAQKYASVENTCKKNGAHFVFEKSEQHLARFVAVLPEIIGIRCAKQPTIGSQNEGVPL